MGVFQRQASKYGGSLVVMCDEELASNLNFTSLDDGALMDIANATSSIGNFESVLDCFLDHTPSDRWETWLVDRLMERLEIAVESVAGALREKLVDQPQDGAFVLSFSGDIFAAQVQLRHSDNVRYKIRKQGAKYFGTRHAAALGVAEYIGSSNGQARGIVMASSTAGGITIMIP